MNSLMIYEIRRIFTRHPEVNIVFKVGDANLFLVEQFAIDYSRSSNQPIERILRGDERLTDKVLTKPVKEQKEYLPVAKPAPVPSTDPITPVASVEPVNSEPEPAKKAVKPQRRVNNKSRKSTKK